MTDELIGSRPRAAGSSITNAETIAAQQWLTRRGPHPHRRPSLPSPTPGVTDHDVVERTPRHPENAIGAQPVKIDARLADDSAETIRALLADALKRHRRVRLPISSPPVTGRPSGTSTRCACSLDGRWYLEGWCRRPGHPALPPRSNREGRGARRPRRHRRQPARPRGTSPPAPSSPRRTIPRHPRPPAWGGSPSTTRRDARGQSWRPDLVTSAQATRLGRPDSPCARAGACGS